MKTVFAFVALAAVCTAGAVPQAANVNAAQDPVSRMVSVSYDLSEEAIVTIELFADGEKIETEGAWTGEASKKCDAGTSKFAWWRPRSGSSPAPAVLTAKVNVWTESDPPDYMAVDINCAGQLRYYASTNELPFTVRDGYWRTHAMLFRRIPAKNVVFRMGDYADANTHANETAHEVKLTNDFYLAVFPVTQGQWRRVLGDEKASGSLQQDRADADFCPMDNISYKQTIGSITGLKDGHFYVDNEGVASLGWVYKFQQKTALKNVGIPTEAQWEYACRAGEGGETYDASVNADNDYSALSWNRTNSGMKPQPVGLKRPNAWGLYDMLGNVWEHCLDFYQADLGGDSQVMPYVTIDGYSYAYRSCRGGAYDSYAGDCDCARRTVLSGRYDWAAPAKPNCGVRILVGIH